MPIKGWINEIIGWLERLTPEEAGLPMLDNAPRPVKSHLGYGPYTFQHILPV